MEILDLDMNKRYSYADYMTWADDVRREMYNGFIKLIPSPKRIHQEVSGNLTRVIGNYIYKKPYKAYFAPSDVRLPKDKNTDDKQIFTVVQPDLYVVCDLSKLDDRGCLGAPDFIIEIISPQNAKRDVKDKFELYQEHGVREYWIVHPSDQTVLVYVLDPNNKYQQVGIYSEDDKIPVNIFNGDLQIDLTEVFE